MFVLLLPFVGDAVVKNVAWPLFLLGYFKIENKSECMNNFQFSEYLQCRRNPFDGAL